MTKLINNIADLKKFVRQTKSKNKTIGLVPTMGALHQGHESLIKKSVKKSDVTIVSVFVNPVQFGPNEDFDKYPRTLEEDFNICKKNNADIVFAPTFEEMYGIKNKNMLSDKYLTYVTPPYLMVDTLCGKSRIGHFDGVATVVCKLFNLSECDFAFFGEKDAQQLIIIKKIVKDLNYPLEIISCPIIRDENGLALSSRNTYLSSSGKQKALVLNKILKTVKEAYNNGITESKKLFEIATQMLDSDVNLEYFEFVDTKTLEEKQIVTENTLIAIAVKVENVRLIDNIII